jgi:hypothetical protein
MSQQTGRQKKKESKFCLTYNKKKENNCSFLGSKRIHKFFEIRLKIGIPRKGCQTITCMLMVVDQMSSQANFVR